jgi:hypothetical protein
MDKQVVALVAKNGGKVPLICDVRFFLYPYESRRPVLACAEGVNLIQLNAVFIAAAIICGRTMRGDLAMYSLIIVIPTKRLSRSLKIWTRLAGGMCRPLPVTVQPIQPRAANRNLSAQKTFVTIKSRNIPVSCVRSVAPLT